MNEATSQWVSHPAEAPLLSGKWKPGPAGHGTPGTRVYLARVRPSPQSPPHHSSWNDSLFHTRPPVTFFLGICLPAALGDPAGQGLYSLGGPQCLAAECQAPLHLLPGGRWQSAVLKPAGSGARLDVSHCPEKLRQIYLISAFQFPVQMEVGWGGG